MGARLVIAVLSENSGEVIIGVPLASQLVSRLGGLGLPNPEDEKLPIYPRLAVLPYTVVRHSLRVEKPRLGEFRLRRVIDMGGRARIAVYHGSGGVVAVPLVLRRAPETLEEYGGGLTGLAAATRMFIDTLRIVSVEYTPVVLTSVRSIAAAVNRAVEHGTISTVREVNVEGARLRYIIAADDRGFVVGLLEYDTGYGCILTSVGIDADTQLAVILDKCSIEDAAYAAAMMHL